MPDTKIANTIRIWVQASCVEIKVTARETIRKSPAHLPKGEFLVEYLHDGVKTHTEGEPVAEAETQEARIARHYLRMIAINTMKHMGKSGKKS